MPFALFHFPFSNHVVSLSLSIVAVSGSGCVASSCMDCLSSASTGIPSCAWCESSASCVANDWSDSCPSADKAGWGMQYETECRDRNTGSSSAREKMGIIMGSLLGSFALIAACVGLCVYCCVKHQRQQRERQIASTNPIPTTLPIVTIASPQRTQPSTQSSNTVTVAAVPASTNATAHVHVPDPNAGGAAAVHVSQASLPVGQPIYGASYPMYAIPVAGSAAPYYPPVAYNAAAAAPPPGYPYYYQPYGASMSELPPPPPYQPRPGTAWTAPSEGTGSASTDAFASSNPVKHSGNISSSSSS